MVLNKPYGMNEYKNLRLLSLVTFGLAVAGIVYMLMKKSIFSTNLPGQIFQACMAALMIWARITFGMRSFHATANTTEGGLVTNGPYKIFRHPIYAAIIYFTWTAFLSHVRIQTFAAAVLITLSLIARMLIEEKFLRQTYPEYLNYSKRTARLIPFVF
jgi:protein-S-isoprenylcysteine O-methyltransferase Ste14